NLPSENEDDLSPAATLLGAERREQVRVTLGRISTEKRMALVLFEMEGLTLREIAAMLKVPLQTVWSRVLNGRKDMAKMLTRAYGVAS
ncbi:MAG TPA: sigma factor-like helix-turn-helix DNA-binding protein, partial [bacterium]|nr:sigma factor-like helix-turn-helix DNA-binding protein [bacterium]